MIDRRVFSLSITSVCCALLLAVASVARADQLHHPEGFTFDLPNIGTPWEQAASGDLIVVNDASDKLPELEVFVFPPKTEGTIAEIEQRLPTELVRKGVAPESDPVTSARLVGSANPETIADATVRIGRATLNQGTDAIWAIVQRSGVSLILLGVPKSGIFERGASNFRGIVHGLRAMGGRGSARTGSAPSSDLFALSPFIEIRSVTATSTYVDNSGPEAYAAWRTVLADWQFDPTTKQQIPTSAWCEGKPDEGIGETVTIALAAPTQLDKLHIAAGVWRTQRLFDSNNQPTVLEIRLDSRTVTVQPAASRTWLDVPIGGVVSTIAIKIAGVKKGAMNDSCISKIGFERNHGDLVAVLGGEGDDLPHALRALDKALGEDRPGLDKLLDFPFTLHVPDDVSSPALTYNSWKALDDACRDRDAKLARGDFQYGHQDPCPNPAPIDASDSRPATLVSKGKGDVEIEFPSHNENRPTWRLRWHNGWRLSAVDYR